MKNNTYFWTTMLLFLVVLISCSPKQEKKPVELLHLSTFDYTYLLKMGYTVVPGEATPFNQSQKERIKRLFQADESPISYLRYKSKDTTSIIFYFEKNKLLNHELFIRYPDTLELEREFKALIETHGSLSAVGALASDSNAYLVRDRRTNQYKLVRKSSKDTLISISHPIGY